MSNDERKTRRHPYANALRIWARIITLILAAITEFILVAFINMISELSLPVIVIIIFAVLAAALCVGIIYVLSLISEWFIKKYGR